MFYLLTDLNGNPVLVNLDDIQYAKNAKEFKCNLGKEYPQRTLIYFKGMKEYREVKETPEEIYRIIEEKL